MKKQLITPAEFLIRAGNLKGELKYGNLEHKIAECDILRDGQDFQLTETPPAFDNSTYILHIIIFKRS